MHTLKIDQASFLALAEEVLSRGGVLEFCARGSSMSPAIQDGDTLRVCLHRADELRVGSVILYRDRQGRAVVHRIVAVRYAPCSTYLVRGDASFGRAESVAADQVLGVVAGVQREGGGFQAVAGVMLLPVRMSQRMWLALVRRVQIRL
ncbi:MAG: S24/S26 family peptidase [Anaerolinea sp.]|nr:S24/S26 family peptidase [Anaerolinea sp.]